MTGIQELLLGDCLEIMPTLPNGMFDAIICDLPYGTTQCKWDVIIPFDKLWVEYERLLKPNGVIILFGTEPFSSYLRLSNIKMFRYDIIWEKERPTNIFFMKKQIGKVHEIISVFYKKQPVYNPQMEDRKFNSIGAFGKVKESNTHNNQKYKYSADYDKTKTYPRSVWKINRDTLKGSLHPTQKPLALMEKLIKTYTNEGAVILDNCMGSGTTCLAAKNLNRGYIGIEKDLDYFNKAKIRIE